ncbi:MAG: VanZ family protein [Dehalococcoidia bacterium]|nr:VanZ family protein [Dehalococcoidia bacterium]
MELLRRLAALGAVGTVVAILASTLTPLAIDENGCAFGVPCTLGHAIAFGALGLTLSGLYVTSSFARRNPRRALVMLLLAIWIFASITELAQAEVGRDPSLGDWAADMLGAIGGLLLGGFLLRFLFGARLPSAVPVEAPPQRAARRAARR